MFTRRRLLQMGVAGAAAPLLGASINMPDLRGVPDVPANVPTPQIAVSLRRASESPDTADACRLYGLTRLDGYVIDPKEKDVILWGLREEGVPPLDLSDLVVALRVAHGGYGEKRGNTVFITEPGVSIDPHPEVMRRLTGLLRAMPPDDDARTEARRQWEEVCASPQDVRLDGLPACRATRCLVEADYQMKRVSQGLIELPVNPPFQSLLAERRQIARERAARGEPSLAGSTYNRFWFEPGRFSHQYSSRGDTVFLDRAQIVLRDEHESMRASGVMQASGRVDPLARAFADAWTARMQEIEKAEPIWRDMHNVFRHFALANIIADRRTFREAGFDGDFLLIRYEPSPVSVPASLPGLGRVEEFKHQELQGSRTRTTLLLTSVCGGVSVAFRGRLEERQDVDGKVRDCGNRILACRPDPKAISWPVVG